MSSRPWSFANQANWASDFPTCGQGKEQSPIDLSFNAPYGEKLMITLKNTYRNYFRDRTIFK